MSDNLRRYLAIRDALRQWYPGSLNGHQSRHLITLAMLISGIVGSQHTHLDKVAAQVPDGAKPASRTKRFARWIANDAMTASIALDERGAFVGEPRQEISLVDLGRRGYFPPMGTAGVAQAATA